MHKYIQPLLICPKCGGELEWAITKQTKKFIVNADIHCPACGQRYFIKDRVGNFLTDYEEKPPADNWERIDDYDADFYAKNPDVKQALLDAPVESLNAVDLFLLLDLLQKTENPAPEIQEKIKNVSDLFNRRYRPAELRSAQSGQLNYVWNELREHSGFVLDIASGMGGLVNRLLSATKFDIIASDISYYVLKNSYDGLSAAKKSRLTRIAFDAAASPFRDGSVDMMTTNIGLQEIPQTKAALKECFRICNDKFYIVSMLSPEDDAEGDSIKRDEFKFPDEFIAAGKKKPCMDFIAEAGFKVRCENSVSVTVPKAPRSEFIPNRGLDALPGADTTTEYCTLIAEK